MQAATINRVKLEEGVLQTLLCSCMSLALCLHAYNAQDASGDDDPYQILQMGIDVASRSATVRSTKNSQGTTLNA